MSLGRTASAASDVKVVRKQPTASKITPTGSTARNGDSVARRRFQKGSVYLNKPRTFWLGSFSQYVLDKHGVERRKRKQVTLCPAKTGDRTVGKREAQKLLQPYLDKVNSSLGSPVRERKNATFGAFAETWERDYLSLSKPSTRSGTRSYLKRLKAEFGDLDMREIDAGHVQRLISAATEEGLSPKTIRNLWGVIRQIWDAALAQKYVDALLPKPKLPRNPKKKVRCFTLSDVAEILATSQGEHRVFYWLAAETGLRAGELAGLKLTDIESEGITINQSVWHGKEQRPKTDNALRKLALSPQLVSLLLEQITRQRTKGHEFLFSSGNGTPWDMNVYRQRKLRPLLKSLGIASAGFHAFRHFNSGLMDALRVPLKTIQERMGHAVTGQFTLDVYGGKPEWSRNVEAARSAGAEIEREVQKLELENVAMSDYSGSLTAVQNEAA